MGNIFKRFSTLREARVLMQGLDAAGKTTILYRLKLGEEVTTTPTIGFNLETLQHKGVSFTAWDIGGRNKIRPLMRHYYPNTQALMRHYYPNTQAFIYVVDSNDHERLPEAAEELNQAMQVDDLKDVPLLIMANKQDLPGAMSVEKITEGLGLHKLCMRKWFIVPTCGTTGDGLFEGFDWLSNTLQGISSDKTIIPQDTSGNSALSKNDETKILSKTWEMFKSIFVAH